MCRATGLPNGRQALTQVTINKLQIMQGCWSQAFWSWKQCSIVRVNTSQVSSFYVPYKVQPQGMHWCADDPRATVASWPQLQLLWQWGQLLLPELLNHLYRQVGWKRLEHVWQASLGSCPFCGDSTDTQIRHSSSPAWHDKVRHTCLGFQQSDTTIKCSTETSSVSQPASQPASQPDTHTHFKQGHELI